MLKEQTIINDDWFKKADGDHQLEAELWQNSDDLKWFITVSRLRDVVEDHFHNGYTDFPNRYEARQAMLWAMDIFEVETVAGFVPKPGDAYRFTVEVREPRGDEEEANRISTPGRLR